MAVPCDVGEARLARRRPRAKCPQVGRWDGLGFKARRTLAHSGRRVAGVAAPAGPRPLPRSTRTPSAQAISISVIRRPRPRQALNSSLSVAGVWPASSSSTIGRMWTWFVVNIFIFLIFLNSRPDGAGGWAWLLSQLSQASCDSFFLVFMGVVAICRNVAAIRAFFGFARPLIHLFISIVIF